MKNKKIKCDIYTRVSTTMQVDGYSLDAQKEKLKRYAEFQNMEIVNEYSDEGKSGKSIEGRPEFQRCWIILRMEQMRYSLYWCSSFPDSVVMRQMY